MTIDTATIAMLAIVSILSAAFGAWAGWCLRRAATPPVFQPVVHVHAVIVPEWDEEEYPDPECN